MYIIACRAHCYHLLGLGRVGHPPGEPVGVLGPWTGAQCGQTPSPLANPIHSWHPLNPLMPLTPKQPSTPLGALQCPLMPPIPLLAPEYLESLPAPQNTSDTLDPWCPPDTPKMAPTPIHPLGALHCPLMPPIPLLVFNCCHFATDHLHADKMLIFYHHHFQFSSLCNRPSSRVCPLYNTPSSGVKGTSAVLWSSANFYSISQNMHFIIKLQ